MPLPYYTIVILYNCHTIPLPYYTIAIHQPNKEIYAVSTIEHMQNRSGSNFSTFMIGFLPDLLIMNPKLFAFIKRAV